MCLPLWQEERARRSIHFLGHAFFPQRITPSKGRWCASPTGPNKDRRDSVSSRAKEEHTEYAIEPRAWVRAWAGPRVGPNWGQADRATAQLVARELGWKGAPHRANRLAPGRTPSDACRHAKAVCWKQARHTVRESLDKRVG